MKVSVFLHLTHHQYARSSVDDARVVESESPLLPGIRSVTTEVGGWWIELENINLEDVERKVERGRAYH